MHNMILQKATTQLVGLAMEATVAALKDHAAGLQGMTMTMT